MLVAQEFALSNFDLYHRGQMIVEVPIHLTATDRNNCSNIKEM
jgi:hypothetical protein